MFCKNCGIENKSNSLYCSNCGNPILQDNSKNEKKSDSVKKITILALLVVIIILLSVTAIIAYSGGLNNKTRTIMIYMDGSNLESKFGIASADISSIDPEKVDLNKIKVYIYTGGTENWKNFVLNDENAIYELKKDGFQKIKTYEKKNMGDPDTLNDLLTYAYNNSKTDEYNLVMYNHGGATDGAIYDEFTGDNLTLEDFKEALEKSPFNSKNKLETVLFRTCLNGTIEIANVFKDYAKYMISSEEVTHGANNTSVLNYINDIENSDNSIEYGKRFITAYYSQMQIIDPEKSSSDPMYSVIDLSKIDKLNKEFNKFIGGIDLNKNYSDIVRARSSMFQFGKNYYDNADYDTVDLYSLITKLEPYSNVNSSKLKKIYDETVLYNWSYISDAKGISIYFPYSGKESAQNHLMKVYNNVDYSDNYKKFIIDFKNKYSSNESTSFAVNFAQNKTEISKEKEFSLELTENQKNEYAESLYMVFKKEKDNKFSMVYSSNNTKLENNMLKTNISSNLIKVKMKEENDYFFIPIVERVHDSKKVISFGGILENFDDEFVMDSARFYVDYNKKGNPYLVNAILNDDDKNGIGGVVANLDSYTTYAILSSHYNILDINGNYTENWDNEGIIEGYEFKKKDFKMEKSLLDDGEYYCVFKIFDIYGNAYYSKLIKLN